LGEPAVRANALTGAAIFDRPSALDQATWFEENGSPASARGSPLTFGKITRMRSKKFFLMIVSSSSRGVIE
jgi:hypothetical protein